ncbi:hypothetical protein [Henriciella pelagia]|jgi:hypothetical protein|uniref:Uncharacterized protein n=1 Tax=Henriciella pelagia TaxID=1977912 RepID=A0ABQ1JJM8_9PROT|nr:hypothetical protein [Henriciella pelagia]GGB68849.1 hypothetical protein GCM10011503_16830 [Henriciella pelagia]
MNPSRRHLIMLAGTTALAAPLGACGTLLYPERRGQTGGQLDTAVVILDGLGLLLFLVPGLIAFAVDFGSGAIYLPGGRRADTSDGYEQYAFKGKLTAEKFDRAYEAQYGEKRDFEFDQLQRIEVSDVAEMHRKMAMLNADVGFRG